MAKWLVDIWRKGDLLVVDTVEANAPTEAILKVARAARIWPKRYGLHAERVAGSTWWAYPTRPARGGGVHVGDRYIAHVREVWP